MTRKRARRQHYESRRAIQRARQAQSLIERAATQLSSGDYDGTLKTCQMALPLTNGRPFQRVEVLNCTGTANLLLNQFDAAYKSFSLAVRLLPNDPYLWYHRGLASRFTMRSGQALRDFQQAVKLEGSGQMAPQYVQAAQHIEQFVQQHLAMRGPGFTIDQLIAQEEQFQQAVEQMAVEEWATAEDTLRQVIALADGPPQPWSNLGTCLLMQQRYAEAEDAYKRALEIDPTNENARYNLEMLAEIRSTGGQPVAQVSDPFAEQAEQGEAGQQ
jgi:tetratricopeptide (TPR) repeat protein